jgi:hypothetical protein
MDGGLDLDEDLRLASAVARNPLRQGEGLQELKSYLASAFDKANTLPWARWAVDPDVSEAKDKIIQGLEGVNKLVVSFENLLSPPSPT